MTTTESIPPIDVMRVEPYDYGWIATVTVEGRQWYRTITAHSEEVAREAAAKLFDVGPRENGECAARKLMRTSTESADLLRRINIGGSHALSAAADLLERDGYLFAELGAAEAHRAWLRIEERLRDAYDGEDPQWHGARPDVVGRTLRFGWGRTRVECHHDSFAGGVLAIGVYSGREMTEAEWRYHPRRLAFVGLIAGPIP